MARAGPCPTKRDQALHGPLVGHQAELGRRDAERGVGGGDAQVAGHRQLGAGAEGGAVDGGDGRERRRAQAVEQPVERLDEGVVLDRGEVGAGAEVAGGAGQHERPGGRRGRGASRAASEPVEGLVVEGVAPLGAVDGDQR